MTEVRLTPSCLAIARLLSPLTFGIKDYRSLSIWLTEQARGTDNGLALVTMLISEVRHRRIVVPTLTVMERLALACRARARREAYSGLSRDLC